MQFNLLTLIGISLAAMFFGYFFGLFEGRGQGYKKHKQETEGGQAKDAALQTPLPSPDSPASPVESSLLRLSRDQEDQIRLDLDGQRVDTARLAPQQRKRLIDLMVLMRPWIEAGTTQKTVPPSQPLVRPAPPPPSPAAKMRTPPAATPLSQAKAAPTRSAPAPLPKEDSTPTSMVGQIDAILQTRLIGTPLEDRGIQLVESAEGTVIVVVGKDRYAGVGEVPDPVVQAAIKAAISEWERRYTPGS
jgi:hypothetical protein